MSLGSDLEIPCRTTITITPTISGGTNPYNYSWNDGSTNSELTTEGGIIITYANRR